MKTYIKNLFLLPAPIGMRIAIKIWHDLPVATRKYLVEVG
jgi:hypothetical protein